MSARKGYGYEYAMHISELEIDRALAADEPEWGGEPPVISTEVLLRCEGKLIYATYRTSSMPGASRQALAEHPGAAIVQVRRLVEKSVAEKVADDFAWKHAEEMGGGGEYSPFD